MATSLVSWWTVPARVGALPTDSGVGSIEAEQAQVVKADHRQAISLAQYAVDQFQADLNTDDATLAGDRSIADHADAVKAAADARLGGDQAALQAATAALTAANAQVAEDKARMEAIAVGMYTGQLTDPQPAGLAQLEEDQRAIIDAAEVAVVAHVIDGHIASDIATARGDARRQAELAAAVASDKSTAATAAATAAVHEKRVATDETVVGSDRAALGGAQARLDAAEAALQDALAAVEDGSGPDTISVLGGPALDAAQLVGWYNWMGYADLTSTPIGQFAQWYLQAGDAEGVRGDVAFAQAVLETGGFSSPDSVENNNFAGIGHCDSCSAGWSFPSAYAGVLGQVQLLRIWAGGGSPSDPVLSSLTTSKQFEAGCCSSFESLTGVWATDPTYGSQILGIYQGMLDYALSG